MPFAAEITDDDLAPFPQVIAYNGDDTVNTITATVTHQDGTTAQYRKTFGYSGGLMVTATKWVKL